MPADQALVLVDHPQRVVEVDAALRDDVGHGGEPGLADVQERDDLGVAARQDVARKAAEGGRARAARVDDGGDAGVDAAEVGIDAGAVDALEDVGVQVDQAGRDDLTADLDDARGLGRRDAWRDPRDHAVLHRHVERAVEPAGRVHDCAALQHEIVHAWPPKAARRMARAMINLSGRAASYPFGPAATSQNLCDDALTMSKPAGRIHEIEHHAADWATTRPVVSGTQGVIAAGHPLVSMAGMRMLLAGGNAFDAAVAGGLRRRRRGADRVLHALRRVRGARLRRPPPARRRP